MGFPGLLRMLASRSCLILLKLGLYKDNFFKHPCAQATWKAMGSPISSIILSLHIFAAACWCCPHFISSKVGRICYWYSKSAFFKVRVAVGSKLINL